MINPGHIRRLRTDSTDYAETESLKAEFRECRSERNPFFLTAWELYRIFHWKLRSQYGRVIRQLTRTSDAAYRAVTQAVLQINGPNPEYECAMRC